MATKTNQACEYKGRKYRLLWSGQTKYGARAHLEFFSGDKDFWVSADAVTVLDDSPRASSGRSSGNVCADCGKGGPLVRDMEDGLMKHRRCCDMEPD